MRFKQKIFITAIILFLLCKFSMYCDEILSEVLTKNPIRNFNNADRHSVFNFSLKYIPQIGITASENFQSLLRKSSTIEDDEKMLKSSPDFFTDRGRLFMAIGAVSAGIGTGIGSVALILYLVQKTVVDETSEIMYLALGITGSVLLAGSTPFFVIGALTLYKSEKAKVSLCYAFVF